MTDGNNVEVEYHHLARQNITITAKDQGVPRMRDFVTEMIMHGVLLAQDWDLVMDLTTIECDQET
jgi:hypothetical protein